MKWRLGIVALIFAVAAFLPMSPASTWTKPGGQAQSVAGDSLADARRATSDASAQLSLLTAGTSQLVSGVAQLDEGGDQLANAITQAHDGAQQLSSGMVQLQAGTGQLGNGATQLADSVGQVVDQVAGFEAVRGQVIASIDRALDSTKNSKDPDVIASRDSLKSLREQAATAEIPADAVAKMNQLRDGSRDLANQLAVPGYSYHDGIYTATNGAASLASGLAELESKVGEATGGIDQLVDGAGKIDHMANESADKVGAVRAALPVAVASSDTGGTAGSAPSQQAAAPAGPTLSPVAAMLLAALTVFGGAALAAAAYFAPRGRWWVLGGGTAIVAAAGTLLAWILGSGFGVGQYALIAGGLTLGTLASAGLTRVLAGALGPVTGFGVAGVLALAETGLVGWVWRNSAAAPVDQLWVAISQALPMHWAATVVSAGGNSGDYRGVVSALLASAVLAVLGLGGARGRR